MTIHFTAAQRAAVFGLRMAGQSIHTVASIMGCSGQRITRELPQDWRGTLKSVLRAPAPRPRRPYGARRVRDELIIALHDGGKRTLQEVGDLVGGITRERVRQILARNGVSVRNNGVLPPDVHRERFDQFIRAIKPGLTTTKVLAAVGLSYGEVSAAAAALGVPMPKTVRGERLRYREIADFYVAHPTLTGSDVAKHFNVSQTAVSRALVKMGVHSRQSGWRWERDKSIIQDASL